MMPFFGRGNSAPVQEYTPDFVYDALGMQQPSTVVYDDTRQAGQQNRPTPRRGYLSNPGGAVAVPYPERRVPAAGENQTPVAPNDAGQFSNYIGACTQADIQSGRCPQPVRRVAAPVRRPVAAARPVQSPVSEPAPMAPMNPVTTAVGLPPDTRPERGPDFAVSTAYADPAPGVPYSGSDLGVQRGADMAQAYLNGDAVPLHIARRLDTLVSGYVQGDMSRRGIQNQQEIMRLAADGGVQDAAEKFTAQGVPPAVAMRLAMGPRMTRDAYGAAAQDQQDAQFEGANAANNFGMLAGRPAGYGVNFAPRYVKSGDGTVNYMLGNSNVTKQLPEGVSPLMYMGAAQNSMADEPYEQDALTSMIQGVESNQGKAEIAAARMSLLEAQAKMNDARAVRALRPPVARAAAGVKSMTPLQKQTLLGKKLDEIKKAKADGNTTAATQATAEYNALKGIVADPNVSK